MNMSRLKYLLSGYSKQCQWSLLIKVSVFYIFGVYMTQALAYGGDVSTIDTALQGLIDILTGKSARLIAVLTIAGVGYMTLCGRLPIKHAVYVCLGIGIIFGATSIASLLGA
jgi:type IV secretion system protein VirB2